MLTAESTGGGGEEEAFLLCPVGHISWFERVGRTFGTAAPILTARAGAKAGYRDMHDVTWPHHLSWQ